MKKAASVLNFVAAGFFAATAVMALLSTDPQYFWAIENGALAVLMLILGFANLAKAKRIAKEKAKAKEEEEKAKEEAKKED